MDSNDLEAARKYRIFSFAFRIVSDLLDGRPFSKPTLEEARALQEMLPAGPVLTKPSESQRKRLAGKTSWYVRLSFITGEFADFGPYIAAELTPAGELRVTYQAPGGKEGEVEREILAIRSGHPGEALWKYPKSGQYLNEFQLSMRLS